MVKEGKLIIICGPSGVGKKTIWTGLLDDKKYNTIFSVSMTTRPQRLGEINGSDYYFVDFDAFQKAIRDGKLLEHAMFANNYYGTPKQPVYENLKNGKNVFLEIEPQGVIQILNSFNKPEEIISIFIAPPKIEDLRQRLESRSTEPKEVIESRIEQAKWELTTASKFKYHIVNDDIEHAKLQLKKILDENLLNAK